MSSRTEARLAAVLMLVAAACPEEEKPPPPAPPRPVVAEVKDAGAPEAPKVEKLPALVMEFGGTAEVKRAGSDEWVALGIGDAVRVGDEVRTSPDGHLELKFDVGHLKVHEGSELTLQILDAKAISAQVQGVAEADLPGGDATLQTRDGALVAKSASGRVLVGSDDKRAWAGALDGAAQVNASGKSVDLKPGELATADGAGVGRPAKVPKKVSLDVRWPAQTETNQPSVSLGGRASAYARVLVQGRRVDVSPDGAFSAKVPLRKGKQAIVVTAVDPFGRRAVQSRQFLMDPNAPPIRGSVEYR